MSYAVAHLLNANARMSAHFDTIDIPAIVADLNGAPAGYSKRVRIQGNVGSEIAEEMFDLSNNPSRQDERDELYGSVRSVSVGDVIQVRNGPGPFEWWLCCSAGWKRIDIDKGAEWAE